MEHTPGPWTISGDSIVTDDICIANIETDGGYEAPGDQREANASLIAAAPDLLTELTAMTDAYAKAMKDAGVTHYPEALAVVRKARAIIAKAKGGK